ncbi:MAG TPA: malto-oligosyltrehalose trehalohydrolase [Thermoanaerobaculia bacterium]|nr:malto-oligosyltrehalose trehalohydrolase [Thermoanaerobaculia bacterium]
MTGWSFTLGAVPAPAGGTRFRVWAPRAERVEVSIVEPAPRVLELSGEGDGPGTEGFFSGTVDAVAPGALYLYRLHRGGGDLVERPDPASRHQPHGVHGPSQVVAPAHPWSADDWRGLALAEHVLYELHVGTFTAEGTFEAVIRHLDDLVDLGVTAIELMPVAQFPGERNWGYDGVFPYAVQASYGGPAGLRRLVDAAHRTRLAVILDVVYNHLGAEGNVLADYGPYFTDRYRTPWGEAINYDGADSDAVRHFFVENALHWLREYRLDGLRCDAVHAIVDNSERTFLEELAGAVHDEAAHQGRRVHLFAESANNTLAFLRSPEHGGAGFDAQWSDDFHHALHTLLTGEDAGYYRDFGRLEQLARAYREGFVYSGQYSPFRRRRHGVSGREVAARRFVVFAQNHDQTGNRAGGERLATLVDGERLKLAAGALLLAPYVPLLFMGEEWGEESPFQYFVSHGDRDLVAAVRRGRAEELAGFGGEGEVPDPQAEETFLRSRLDRSIAERPQKAALRALYRELLRLRREIPALARLANQVLAAGADEAERVLHVMREAEGGRAFAVFNFAAEDRRPAVLPAGRWRRLLDSSARRWGGPREAIAAAEGEELESAGEEPVALSGWSFQLFVEEAR